MKNLRGRGWRLGPFQKKIKYRFKNIELLQEALTHPSLANESGLPFDNQRLEFLGDAVLELVVSERLFKENGDFNEGTLTRARSQLVRKSSLSKWAVYSGISELLRYGKSLGGEATQAMLADAAEAVFGAVFLDGGYEAARGAVETFFDFISPEVGHHEPDPKTRLQELLQARGAGVPYYRLTDKKGPDHALHFRVQVTLDDGVLGEAWGTTMKEAEFEAARRALKHLG